MQSSEAIKPLISSPIIDKYVAENLKSEGLFFTFQILEKCTHFYIWMQCIITHVYACEMDIIVAVRSKMVVYSFKEVQDTFTSTAKCPDIFPCTCRFYFYLEGNSLEETESLPHNSH